MNELRETLAVVSVLVSVCSIFMLVSTLLMVIYWYSSGISDTYLLKFLAVDILVAVMSTAAGWILSDEVWSRKNMPHAERKMLFNLK